MPVPGSKKAVRDSSSEKDHHVPPNLLKENCQSPFPEGIAKTVSTSLPSQERSCITYRLARGEKKPPWGPGSVSGAIKCASIRPVLTSNKASLCLPSAATHKAPSTETVCRPANLSHNEPSGAARGRQVAVSMERSSANKWPPSEENARFLKPSS